PWSPVWFSFLIFSVALSAAALVMTIRFGVLRRREGGKFFGPFAVAALAGVATDILSLAITGKLYFPPYTQPLLPFLFLPHATAGMILGRSAKGRVVLGVLLALWAIGGAEATWAYSRGVDGRNGLAVK